jgi:DNA invertase Pin-like site-specific DNA recombinase
MRGAGCTKIYREKVTGAHNDRPERLKMLKGLARGDVVMVTRIGRLARSTFDLFAIVKQIVDAKAQFRFIGRAAGRHRHRAIDDSRVGRLGGRGTRSNPHPHSRGPAQKRGQYKGRPPKLTAARQAEARRRRAQGATLAELARSYHVGKSTRDQD